MTYFLRCFFKFKIISDIMTFFIINITNSFAKVFLDYDININNQNFNICYF